MAFVNFVSFQNTRMHCECKFTRRTCICVINVHERSLVLSGARLAVGKTTNGNTSITLSLTTLFFVGLFCMLCDGIYMIKAVMGTLSIVRRRQ